MLHAFYNGQHLTIRNIVIAFGGDTFVTEGRQGGIGLRTADLQCHIRRIRRNRCVRMSRDLGQSAGRSQQWWTGTLTYRKRLEHTCTTCTDFFLERGGLSDCNALRIHRDALWEDNEAAEGDPLKMGFTLRELDIETTLLKVLRNLTDILDVFFEGRVDRRQMIPCAK